MIKTSSDSRDVLPPPVQTQAKSAGFNYSGWIRAIAIAWGLTIVVMLLWMFGRATQAAMSGNAIYSSTNAHISATENYVNTLMGSICGMIGLSPLFAIPIGILAILRSNQK